jgi:hypothetical protein
MPLLRQLDSGVSLRRTGLVHMGFVVDKVALGQVFLVISSVFRVSIIPPWLHAHISSGGWTVGPFVATVKRRCVTPLTRKSWHEQLSVVWSIRLFVQPHHIIHANQLLIDFLFICSTICLQVSSDTLDSMMKYHLIMGSGLFLVSHL